MKSYDYDVVIYDNVGSPIDPKWAAEKPVGGSEYGMTQLAVGLYEKGYSVLTVSNLPDNWIHEQCDGPHCIYVKKVVPTACKVLVSSRFSNPDFRLKGDKYYIAAMDVYCAQYAQQDRLAQMLQGKPTAVFVSEWQASLFPSYWNKTIVPAMIDDEVYNMRSLPKNPKQFVYASSPIKGLDDTLRVWAIIKGKLRGTPYDGIELLVTSPGYGAADLDFIQAAGATWVGPKPTTEIQKLIASSAGLFFVNTFPETFCAVAAVAEATGARCHVLTKGSMGALRQTINSGLLTDNEELFIDQFISSLNPAVWRPDPVEPNNFRRSHVLNMWEKLLFEVESTEEDIVSRRERRAQASINRKAVHVVKPKESTIGLIMIAKDEAHVLARSLGSVKHLLDYYTIILDSENSDNSEEVIKNTLGRIPGQILYEPYVNVSYARNRSIKHGSPHTDYLLPLDADDVAEGTIDKTQLGADYYDVKYIDGSALTMGGNVPVNDKDMGACTYNRPILVKSNRGFKYIGIDHEYVFSAEPFITRGVTPELVVRRYTDGRSWTSPEIVALKQALVSGRIDQAAFDAQLPALCDDACRQKYFKRAQLLEKELAENPTDTRTAYYCAQNYRDARCSQKSIEMFLRRTAMPGGWDQETFISYLHAADQLFNRDPVGTGAISWENLLLRACVVYPPRMAEALYHLALNHYSGRRIIQAYIFSKATLGMRAPDPNQQGFLVDENVYRYKAAMIYGWSAFQLGFKQEAGTLIDALIPYLPPSEAEQGRKIVEECRK